jgi:hypothetical protein
MGDTNMRRFREKVSYMHFREPTTPLEAVFKRYGFASSGQVMDVVLDGWPVLQDGGLLEEAFLAAWSYQKWGFPNWTKGFCDCVFHFLQREKLLAAGDPVPPGDSFLVYRGVAGLGAKRRVRGHSWTRNIDVARNFADIRGFRFKLPNPAVYSAVIRRQHVLAYINESGRNEHEFLVLPRYLSKLKCIEQLSFPLAAIQENHTERSAASR